MGSHEKVQQVFSSVQKLLEEEAPWEVVVKEGIKALEIPEQGWKPKILGVKDLK